MNAERQDIPEDGQAARPVCLLVLGIHRSGTSAVTRFLNLLGATMPKHVLGVKKGSNETGHWEPANLINFHEELLEELDSGWWDWRAFDISNLSLERQNQIKAKIVDIIKAEYGDASLIVIKDPRICRFVDLFSEVLEDAGYDVRSILAIRNPMEVTQSLEKRDEFLKGKSSLIWLRHVLDAERDSRGQVRIILSYDELLSNWQEAADRIAYALGLDWPQKPSDITSTVNQFLSPSHRHNQGSMDTVAQDPILKSWVHETYNATLELLKTPTSESALGTLDRVRTSFDDALPVLFPLLDETDKELAARASKILEQQEEIDERGRLMEFRDQQITLRDQQLLEAGEIITDITDARDQALLKIDQYENSLSWRITKPLRDLKKAQTDFKDRFRKSRQGLD